jgi:hypothetical protein
MQDLDSVEKIDKEIKRLEQLRQQVIVNEEARVKRAMKEEVERFNAVAINRFVAYSWADPNKKSTQGSYDVVEINNDDSHFFIVIDVDPDGSVSTEVYPGPVSFAERFSLTVKP